MIKNELRKMNCLSLTYRDLWSETEMFVFVILEVVQSWVNDKARI